MMPSNYKKSELLELLQIVGITPSPKSIKATLEADIIKHLNAVPNDAQLDQRLASFVDKPNPPSEEEEEAPVEEYVEEKLEEVSQAVGGVWTKVSGRGFELTHRVASSASELRSRISTVATVNWLLIILEVAAVVYLTWPRTILENKLTFGIDEVRHKFVTQWLLYSTLLLLPALAFSFVINFTKKNAIRRKKHTYTFDPILFGLGRFFSAVLFKFICPDLPYTIIAGTSGLTSALVGIYASILQTP